MKILVIGLGSMGRRRVRLLKQIDASFEIIGIDNNSDRRLQAENEFKVKTCDDLAMALCNMQPECAVISTSPLSHASIIATCLKHGCHVFTEPNLVSDQYDENLLLAKKQKKILFLSSTFLYRDEIKYIAEKVANTDGLLNYNYHVGQYLPDWHPWESIQNYFVGDKRTNGCRELFAIELPWIIKTFGEIKSYKVVSDRNTQLPIEYNDNYMLLVEHDTGHKGVFCVDVVSRRAVRNLEVYGENLYMTWDGTPAGLKEYDYENRAERDINLYKAIDKQEGYASFVIENAYKNELETFIRVVNGTGHAEYTFEDDKKVLSLIDEIEAGKRK